MEQDHRAINDGEVVLWDFNANDDDRSMANILDNFLSRRPSAAAHTKLTVLSRIIYK